MNTVESNSLISVDVIKRKIRRMAFEIAERNWNATSLVIAGVSGNGEIVAKCVVDELEQIVTFPLEKFTIHLDKAAPQDAYIDTKIDFNNKNVVVIDDVANTGMVLLYSLRPLLSFRPTSIQTLVLVERSHKLFPVQIDYVGLSISTTLKEHISIKAEEGNITGVYLH